MNKREKTLITTLFGVAFFIVNIFLFTSYQAGMQKKRSQLGNGAKQIKQMEQDLAVWESQAQDVEWLSNNQPGLGVHGNIGADLVKETVTIAQRHGVVLSGLPSPLPADNEEFGVYRSARVKVKANAMDDQLYKWLTDLQDPARSRSITSLQIAPNPDDKSRVDCELEVAQWFTPQLEEEVGEEMSDPK